MTGEAEKLYNEITDLYQLISELVWIIETVSVSVPLLKNEVAVVTAKRLLKDNGAIKR